MPIDPYFSRLHLWIDVDEVRVLKLDDGEVSDEEFELFPQGTDRMEVRLHDTWLIYRIFDSSGTLIEGGAYPPWRVVEVKSTV